MDDGSTVLLVFCLADPGGCEGAEGGKSGGTLPDGVLSIGGGDDTDLRACRSESGDLGLETIGDAFVHGGATGEDDVLEEVASHIDIGSLDGLPGKGMDGVTALAVQLGLEEELRDLHANGALHGDLASIGKRVCLVLCGGRFSSGSLGVVVLSDKAELFLDILDDFELSS